MLPVRLLQNKALKSGDACCDFDRSKQSLHFCCHCFEKPVLYGIDSIACVVKWVVCALYVFTFCLEHLCNNGKPWNLYSSLYIYILPTALERVLWANQQQWKRVAAWICRTRRRRPCNPGFSKPRLLGQLGPVLPVQAPGQGIAIPWDRDLASNNAQARRKPKFEPFHGRRSLRNLAFSPLAR